MFLLGLGFLYTCPLTICRFVALSLKINATHMGMDKACHWSLSLVEARAGGSATARPVNPKLSRLASTQRSH